MKHGRFLATISSATVLASSFCAAVPTYDDKVDVALSLLFFAGCPQTDIDSIATALENQADYKETKLRGLYKRVHIYLKKEKWFSEDDLESEKIEDLAEGLINKYCIGYQGAKQYWRECYDLVMREVLKAKVDIFFE